MMPALGLDAYVFAALGAMYDQVLADGWQQGAVGYSGEPRCLTGHALSVFGLPYFLEDTDICPIYDSIERAIVGRHKTTTLPGWNDADGRTLADVLCRLLDARREVAEIGAPRVPECTF